MTWFGFLLGLWIGACIGVFVAGLLAAAADGDEVWEQVQEDNGLDVPLPAGDSWKWN